MLLVGVGKLPSLAIWESVGRRAAFGDEDLFEPPSVAVGVGNHNDPISEVRGTKGRRGNSLPLRIVPEGGKAPEYSSHPPPKEPWYVLHDDVAGSYHAEDALELGPEPARVFLPEALARVADRLAGKPSGHNVNGCELSSMYLLHVAAPEYAGPLLLKDTAAVIVDLDLPCALHAGLLQAEIEPSEAGEEAAEPQNNLPFNASAATGLIHRTSVRYWPFSARARLDTRAQSCSPSMRR